MKLALAMLALTCCSCGDRGAPVPDAPDGPDAGSICGDGIIEYLEQCDDGATLPDDGCSEDCRLEVGRFEVTWSIQSTTGTAVPCSAGWTVQLVLVGPQMFDELYSCDQAAPLRTVSLLLGDYTFTATLKDDTGATLAEQTADGTLVLANETVPVAILLTMP